jgi:PPOX class probable F420-dependent enzyme
MPGGDANRRRPYNQDMDLPTPVRRFIERQRVARLATVDPSGLPHLIPICFALEGDTLYSVVDEKPKRTSHLQRLRNIEAHPDGAVLLDEYNEDWTRLAWVMLRGRAAICPQDAEYWRALSALTKRYPQYRGMALEGNPLIRIECDRATYWGNFEVPPPVAGEAEVVGLHLVRGLERVAAPHVTTEHRAGVSSGGVSRLRPAGDGASEEPVESQDEAAMPDEGGRMLRYPLADLEDGFYVAESVGAASAVTHTYFEVRGARVTRIFGDRRRALRELKRTAR